MVQIAKLQAGDTIRNNSHLLHSNSLNNDTLNGSLKRDYAANAEHSFTKKHENYFENDLNQIINLAYCENCSHEDISKRLCVPLKTVKTKLRMAIMKIRESVVNY